MQKPLVFWVVTMVCFTCGWACSVKTGGVVRHAKEKQKFQVPFGRDTGIPILEKYTGEDAIFAIT